MSKNNAIKFGNYFKLPNPGLRAYFDRVSKGQSEVYTAPFGYESDIQDLLNDWVDHLGSLRDTWPSLYEYELDMRSKVGPMSVMKPLKDRIADIDHYYNDILSESDPILDRAWKATISEWKGKGAVGLHVRNVRNTLLNMKLSTNSGSPYFSKRKRVIDDTVPFTINEDIQNLSGGTYNYCAILGWRGQEGGPNLDDIKQRVVWMFPFAVNISELQVYQPLISTAQHFNLIPAYVSMDAVDYEITNMFDSKSEDDYVICTDFTKFDQHFNASLQNCSKQILRAIFTPTEAFNRWVEHIYDIKYNIPLAYDFNYIRYGAHGMASGSGGTNADETLAHRSLQYEAAIKSNSRLNKHSQCLGDDGILTFTGIDVDKIIDVYTSHGLEMNSSKQYVSKDECIYLRRWHHTRYRVGGRCVGVYSTCRAIGRLRYLERYMDPEVWGPRAVALRQLSILENCKYHPLGEEFVRWCMKRDRYRLGIDIPGFFDKLEIYAKEATDVMPDFVGYVNSLQIGDDYSGISDWWVVKLLKSLSGNQ